MYVSKCNINFFLCKSKKTRTDKIDSIDLIQIARERKKMLSVLKKAFIDRDVFICFLNKSRRFQYFLFRFFFIKSNIFFFEKRNKISIFFDSRF